MNFAYDTLWAKIDTQERSLILSMEVTDTDLV